MPENSPKLPLSETPISNVKLPERNPALRILGIPNLKLKLPSRNWMIFLSVTSSIASLILYDKYQTRKIREKWCRAVSHLAEEPLGIKVMPRKLTIYLSAPPGDGLKSARDHFAEYVKPVLVAAALDWDVVEGRREGDVRVRLAEQIREQRRRAGEGELEPESDSVADVRRATGVSEWSGEAGDIVIGRNTWKEYIRGLHEGWLGPLTQPAAEPLPSLAPEPLLPTPRQEPAAEVDAPQEAAQEQVADSLPTPPAPAAKKATLTSKTPAYISTSEYSSAPLPPSLPQTIGPSTALPFPHILGFFNTPVRVYRFMTRRWLAESIGRETAAVVLGTFRPFQELRADASASSTEGGSRLEQEELLAAEELEWHKSVRVREDAEQQQQRERVWLDPVVLDSRIAERMRRFELSAEDERAAHSMNGQAGRNREEELLR
ncbi:MAG: mitochondrial import inner membrane translocase subunit tim54 [Trizodia sp. TS-e1964]|nr:MAG: mitochondrial import inner membrane translocase subunit tim54 [Trizodia sp. TS-e1964]